MIKGQLSIFDFIQEERLADRYHDGIPETIQEVVEIVEQRTGLKFKERKPVKKSYKSIIGMYECKYKKAKFELELGRFAEGVNNESRYIGTNIEYGLWGRSVPAYDIDETLSLIKRWKGEYE